MTTTKRVRVVLYVRVSTEEQALEGVSIAAQEAKLRAYSDLYDLEVVEVIVDAGCSAKNLKRAGLTRALGLLKSKQADGLVVTKLDRLSRSVLDWNVLIDDYFGEKAGRVLFSVGDSIDTRTAAGRLVLNVLMSVAQWEREAIGERTRDAMAYKSTKNELVGEVPYGFEVSHYREVTDRDGAVRKIPCLSPVAAEQAVVGKIRAWREGGLSLRAIAAKLTQDGVLTKTGKPAWYFTSVKRILDRA